MNNLRIKILAGLCLWLLSVQGIMAFTFASEFPGTEDNPRLEFKEASGPGLVYINQIHILKIESVPQHKVPLLPFPILSSSSLIFEKEEGTTSVAEFAVRDHRYGLKLLVFPYHFFW